MAGMYPSQSENNTCRDSPPQRHRADHLGTPPLRRRPCAVQPPAGAGAAADEPVAQADIAYYRLDAAGRIVAANDIALRLWGTTEAGVIGRRFLDVFPQAHDSAAWRQHLAVLRCHRAARLETRSPVLNRWIDLALHPEPDGGVSASFRDISDRRRRVAGEKELRHRIANDVQFVLSHLELARGRIADADTQVLLDRAIDRATFSARLQRQLLGSPDERIDPAPILSGVVAQTLGGFPDLHLEIAIAPVKLPRAQVTPLVLLVWEAATNAAKHVFRPGRGTRFVLSLGAGADGLRLAIADDGPGLSPEGCAAPHPGLGRDIMGELADELGGRLEIMPGPGTRLHLHLPG